MYGCLCYARHSSLCAHESNTMHTRHVHAVAHPHTIVQHRLKRRRGASSGCRFRQAPSAIAKSSSCSARMVRRCPACLRRRGSVSVLISLSVWVCMRVYVHTNTHVRVPCTRTYSGLSFVSFSLPLLGCIHPCTQTSRHGYLHNSPHACVHPNLLDKRTRHGQNDVHQDARGPVVVG